MYGQEVPSLLSPQSPSPSNQERVYGFIVSGPGPLILWPRAHGLAYKVFFALAHGPHGFFPYGFQFKRHLMWKGWSFPIQASPP